MKIRKLVKNKFGFIEPMTVMIIVVSLIVFAVGVFAFFTLSVEMEQVGPSVSGRKCWNIGTPNNPETYNNLPTNTNGITRVVEHFEDGSTNVIDAGNYTWVETNPTYISVNVTGG